MLLDPGRCGCGFTALSPRPLRKAVARMKRMLLLATAGLVAAAMMVAMSAPAFAATTCKTSSDGLTFTCSGGERVTQPGGIATGVAGGQGGHSVYECGL